MLSDREQNTLNMLFNHFMMLGNIYNACMRDFKAGPIDEDKGVVAFLYHEMENRFKTANKIADYIQAHEGKVVFNDIKKPEQKGATLSAIGALYELCIQTKATIEKLYEVEPDKENVYANFLKMMVLASEHTVWKTKAIFTKLESVMDIPFEYMLFNEWLCEQYCKEDNPGHGYNNGYNEGSSLSATEIAIGRLLL